MTFIKKILVTAGIGSVIAGILYAFRLKRTRAELETQAAVTVKKLDTKGLSLQIEITLKNPTRSTFKVKFPFVKVYYKDSLLGTSQVIDKDIDVPSFGQIKASNIIVQLPLSSLLAVGSGLTNLLSSGQPLVFKVETISTINLGVAQIPYTKENEFNLKLPTNAS